MLRYLVLTLLFIVSLLAEDKVEVYASSIDSKDNIVKAYNGVNVIYKGSILSSDRAIYNRNNSILELYGNVRIINGSEYKILGNKARLDLSTKRKEFKPFFMLDEKSNVWLSADSGVEVKNNLDINSGIVSGCNPVNPLWKIEYSSSSYNTKSKWLNLYNARMYLYDIPVFYTPYFGYSLDKTRRTGLLKPSFGVSSQEGIYFEQPFYIAEQNWWDLEFKPQIRSQRGYGLYGAFRFVDSKISKGSLEFGYFKEQENYFLKNDLANQAHYGFNFNYDNSDFINQWFNENLSGQSALYVDIKNMNDVDYQNLSTNDASKTVSSSQILSRINMFYNNDDYYFGAYFKYYKDLSLTTNENTLQFLPTSHYHHYIDSTLYEHLLYNLDIKSKNMYRTVNTKAVQTDINLPITLQTSLFDEYLNLSYVSHLYAQNTKFSGTPLDSSDQFNNGTFLREYNSVELSSQLLKAYKSVIHSISLDATYTFSGPDDETGYYVDNKDFCSDLDNKNDARCEFYNINTIDDFVQLDVIQYLYDMEGAQFIYNKTSQTINNTTKSIGILENEFVFDVTKSLSYSNDIFYDHTQNDISKVVNKLSYSDSDITTSISHLYKNDFEIKTDTHNPITSYITSGVSYTYNSHYSYNAKFNYDLETKLKKSAEIGFMYKKRCWDFGLKYSENNRPILTSGNQISSVYDRFIYITVIFKPIMNPNGATSNYIMRLPQTLQER